MLICREVTVFGSLGFPVAGPIRPVGVCQCSKHQQSAVISPWWPGEARDLRASAQSPKSQSSDSVSVLRSQQSKGTFRSCCQFLQTYVLSSPSWSACVARELPASLDNCYGEVYPNETSYQAKGDTWIVMDFSLQLFRSMQKRMTRLNVLCDSCLSYLLPDGKLNIKSLHYMVIIQSELHVCLMITLMSFPSFCSLVSPLRLRMRRRRTSLWACPGLTPTASASPTSWSYQ